MKIKTYNRSNTYNVLHTILVSLSPRTPRSDRKTPVKLYSYNRENARRARFNSIVTR